MTNKDMANYAALVAAGIITEDALSDLLGDDTIVKDIMAMVGATAITGAASGLIEDTVDVVEDVVDTLNPFNW